jgi:hypothetical protein
MTALLPTLTPAPTAGRGRARRKVLAVTVGLLSMAGVVGLAGPADAATGKTGTHYRSATACRSIASPVTAAQSTVVAAAPVIYAANTTTGLDGQTVRFRQRLLRWNGASWVAAGQSAVWSGFATDSTAGLDFSDGSRTLRRPQITFNAGPGYYAVVTDYWWAATNRTTGGSNVATATHSPSTSVDYCNFRY